MADTKICKKCGRELPISEFSKCKSRKDGLQPYCKECNKQYYAENREAKAEYYDRNREYYTEYWKQWYAKNREDRLEYQKQYCQQYYAENREDKLEYFKQYYADNREDKLEYQKQYYATLRGYCASIRKDNIRADRKSGRIGDELPNNYPTIEDYMELLQLPDFYDGKQYDFSEMGLDRIDNDKPHTLDNVVPCTTEHNRQRQKMPFDEFKTKFIKNYLVI